MHDLLLGLQVFKVKPVNADYASIAPWILLILLGDLPSLMLYELKYYKLLLIINMIIILFSIIPIISIIINMIIIVVILYLTLINLLLYFIPGLVVINLAVQV